MSAVWVQTFAGAPPAGLFASTRGYGTPIIIDTATDVPYYLKSGTPTAFAGGGSGFQFPVGAVYTSTDGTTDPATLLGYGTWSLLGSITL